MRWLQPTTTDFMITVSDGTLSAERPFTIAINGTNDAAIISGTISGTATETGGIANTTLAAPNATGTLTNADVDDPPDTFTAVSSPTASAKGFGTFTMTANGVWAYTIDQANSAVQALNVGDKLTDTFTVTTVDGTAQVVTVTINGANDAAIISGATKGSVTEDSGPKCDDADSDRHAHRRRRRQHVQPLYGSQLPYRQRWRLWHLHDDGRWRVDLQARQ